MNQPPLLHERVLTDLKGPTEAALEAYPEIDAIAITIVWKAPFNGLPLGRLCFRPDLDTPATTLADCIIQLTRMAKFTTEQLEALVTSARNHNGPSKETVGPTV